MGRGLFKNWVVALGAISWGWTSVAMALDGRVLTPFVQTAEGPEFQSGYEQLMSSLKPGDTLRFTDGREVRVGAFLGAGNTTAVFAVQDDPTRVLRVPCWDCRRPKQSKWITASIDGYEPLKYLGIPTVSIHEFHRDEYIIAERFHVEGSVPLDRFIADPTIPKPLRKEMESRLVEFARRTAAFSMISDFRGDQLVYDAAKKDWVLFDWTDRHKLAFSGSVDAPVENSDHLLRKIIAGQLQYPVEYYGPNGPTGLVSANWLKSLQEKIDDAVAKERKKILSSPEALQRALDPAGVTAKCLEKSLLQRLIH